VLSMLLSIEEDVSPTTNCLAVSIASTACSCPRRRFTVQLASTRAQSIQRC
jgi:hypothetical protein